MKVFLIIISIINILLIVLLLTSLSIVLGMRSSSEEIEPVLRLTGFLGVTVFTVLPWGLYIIRTKQKKQLSRILSSTGFIMALIPLLFTLILLLYRNSGSEGVNIINPPETFQQEN